MRVVVAPDKFRSTLTAREAARAICEGIRSTNPATTCIELPLADGGEGSLDVVLAHVGGVRQGVGVHGPDGRTVDAVYGLLADGRAAVEMAAGSGLSLMERPDPLGASSLGTGELIAAASAVANDVIVFVGGSASTDGGTGAARALGWRFVDERGHDVALGGGALANVARIVTPDRAQRAHVIAACDVTNPLLGPAGAARAFGPQKGATPDEVSLLERGLAHVASLIRSTLGRDVAELQHGGAGGGMGSGVAAFFDGDLKSGFDLIASAAGLDDAVRSADLVVTGEGRLDETSFSGKVVSGVIACASRAGVPCTAVVGRSDVPRKDARERGLETVVELGERGLGADAYALVASATRRLMSERGAG